MLVHLANRLLLLKLQRLGLFHRLGSLVPKLIRLLLLVLEWLLLIGELLLWHWFSKLVSFGKSLSICLQVLIAKLCLRLSERLRSQGAKLTMFCTERHSRRFNYRLFHLLWLLLRLHFRKEVLILLKLSQLRSRLELVLGRPCIL